MTERSGGSVSRGKVTQLELSILDEAADFPVPVAELIQPTLWVTVGEGEEGPRVREDPPERISVQAAVTFLLRRGMLQVMRRPGLDPAEPILAAEWERLLEDDATWMLAPTSSICVFSTAAGDAALAEAFTTSE